MNSATNTNPYSLTLEMPRYMDEPVLAVRSFPTLEEAMAAANKAVVTTGAKKVLVYRPHRQLVGCAWWTGSWSNEDNGARPC